MLRKRFLVVGGILLALMVIAACASQAASVNAPSPADYYQSQKGEMLAAPTPAPMIANALRFGGDGTVNEPQQGQQAQQAPDTQIPTDIKRIVLKDAALVIVVDDVDAKMQAITTLSESFGGWIVSANTTRANVNGKNQVQSASITIRVPAARLDDALTQIKTGVGTVESENVTGQDVT